MVQVISLAGAVLLIVAFAGALCGRLEHASVAYALLNAIGAGILTAVAVHEQQWGFVIAEGMWSAISVLLLARILRARPRPAPPQRRPVERAGQAGVHAV